MKIAVFGATGFLGLNLQKALEANFDLQKISLRHKNWCSEIEDKTNIFINLVGKAHDHKGSATAEDFFYANVELTKNIYNAFLQSSAKAFIHISSIAAVEETESIKKLTELDACHPFSHYGKTKREAELWLLAQKLPTDKKLIILRPPMIHGPEDKGNLGFLYKIISKGIPYPLSAFQNHRSFLSIYNFNFYIEEIICAIDLLESGIYHISDDESISTNQIISIIKTIEHKNIPNLSLPKFFVKIIAKLGDIIPIPLNSNRLKKMTSNLLVSNQKIKQALKVEQLPLTAEEGLAKTIQSFKK